MGNYAGGDQTATGSGVNYGTGFTSPGGVSQGNNALNAPALTNYVNNQGQKNVKNTNTKITAGDNNQITYTSSDPDVVNAAIGMLGNQNNQFIGTVSSLFDKSLTRADSMDNRWAGLATNQVTGGAGVDSATGQSQTLKDTMSGIFSKLNKGWLYAGIAFGVLLVIYLLFRRRK